MRDKLLLGGGMARALRQGASSVVTCVCDVRRRNARALHLEAQVILLWIDLPAAVAGRGWRAPLNQVHSDAHLERKQPVTHYAAVSADDPMLCACEQTGHTVVRKLHVRARAIAPYQILLTRQVGRGLRADAHQTPSQSNDGRCILTKPRTRWYQEAVASTSKQERDIWFSACSLSGLLAVIVPHNVDARAN